MKILTQPETGNTFKMGRNRPVARGPRFALRNYLKQSLPAPPASVDYSAKAPLALQYVYGNNELGDCVIACMGHIAGVLAGNVGSELIVPHDEIISLYSAIGGYVPGDPLTDQGCDEQTALNYWQRTGFRDGFIPPSAHQIAAWIAVDGSNPVEVKTALWLFENLMFGVELPDAWVNPMPAHGGFHWNVEGEPDPHLAGPD